MPNPEPTDPPVSDTLGMLVKAVLGTLSLLILIRKFYCTVSLTVLQWGFGLLHRQAARGAECI